MKIKDVINEIEIVAPLCFAQQWDNSGLQIGNTDEEITGVHICLDMGMDVIEEAKTLDANLIISHHPLFFNDIKSINFNEYYGRIIKEIVKNDMCIYSTHTAFDVSCLNMSKSVLKDLGCEIREHKDDQSPFLEIGVLKKPEKIEDILKTIKSTYDIFALSINSRCRPSEYVRVICAVCGSGADFISQAKEFGGEFFITGEMKYHDFQLCNELDFPCVEIGHFESEKSFMEIISSLVGEFIDKNDKNISVTTSKKKSHIKMC